MNSEEFRETFLRTTEKGPPRPRWRGRKKPSERLVRAAKRRSIEKRRGSPQGRKTPRKMLGENQPKRRRKKEVPRGSRIAPGGAGEKKPRKRGHSRHGSKQQRLRKKKTLCV